MKYSEWTLKWSYKLQVNCVIVHRLRGKVLPKGFSLNQICQFFVFYLSNIFYSFFLAVNLGRGTWANKGVHPWKENEMSVCVISVGLLAGKAIVAHSWKFDSQEQVVAWSSFIIARLSQQHANDSDLQLKNLSAAYGLGRSYGVTHCYLLLSFIQKTNLCTMLNQARGKRMQLR